MKQDYQLFPKLRDEEYEALKADIKKRGVLIPVEKDEHGNILDGHHRAQIANELGIPYPERQRRFTSEQEKREHVIKINLARRHLDPVRWGQAFAMLLEERGIPTGKGAVNQHTRASATVAEAAAELGVSERTARDRLNKARTYEKLPEPVKKDVDQGKLTVPQAKRAVENEQKKKELHEKANRAMGNAAKAAKAKKSQWEIVQGEVPEAMDKVKDGTVRLIFADPPYNIGVDYGPGAKADRLRPDKYLGWCRGWINRCAELLADDGSMWVLINDEWADHFGLLLTAAGLHRRAWIKWYETFGVNCANNFNRTSRHLFYCVKDAKRFVFHRDAVNRPSDRQTKYNDARANPDGKIWDDVWMIPRLVGTAKERIPEFPTQLPLDLLRPIVGCASDPGDLVLDPFNGSGTTGAACIELGRRYLGFEKEERFCKLARQRLAGI